MSPYFPLHYPYPARLTYPFGLREPPPEPGAVSLSRLSLLASPTRPPNVPGVVQQLSLPELLKIGSTAVVVPCDPTLPGAPRRVTPGLTLSVAMLPCLSFWPRPLECKVVPGIAGGTVAPAHSGETHSPELPHLSLSDLTTAPSALYRSQLMIRPIIPMHRSTGVTSVSWHISTADKRGYQPFLTQRRPSHLKPGGHLFRGLAPERPPPCAELMRRPSPSAEGGAPPDVIDGGTAEVRTPPGPPPPDEVASIRKTSVRAALTPIRPPLIIESGPATRVKAASKTNFSSLEREPSNKPV